MAEVEEGGATARTKAVEIFKAMEPSIHQNYVMTRTMQVEGITDIQETGMLNISEATLEVQYFDGLGRASQSIAAQASPAMRDIVTPIVYDRFGRDSIQYLPYVSNSPYGNYQQTALGDQQTFYQDPTNNIATDPFPYAIKVLESSPLSRLMEQGAPGEDWQPNNKTVRFDYTTNKTDEVRLFDLDAQGRPIDEIEQYQPNQLSVAITKDEHDNEVREFTDKLGKVVLKRVFLTEDEQLDTYYIYDDFDNLRVVLPPQAIRLFDQYYNQNNDKFLDNWAFLYKYDARKRMVEKKVPGAGWVFMVYDKRDRLVLTQDANQRKDETWIFTKYDHFNRPIMTGYWEDGRNRETIQEFVNNEIGSEDSYAWFELREEGGFLGYQNNSFPKVDKEENVYTVTWYDNYEFIDESHWSDEYRYQDRPAPYSATILENPKGQVTGTMTKVLETNQWIKTVSYYDNKYRVVQGISSNHLGGIDRTDTQYDFVGKVLRTRSSHHVPGKTDKVIEESFTYDHAGRVIEQYHEISIGARFENLTGADTVSNNIEKTTSTGWNNSGAQIENQYIPKGNNGFITARIKDNSGSFAIGLAGKYTNAHYSSMDYALVQETNAVFIWEQGSKLATTHHVRAGDIVKVERSDQKISYKINGKTIYRSHGRSMEALRGVIAIKIRHLAIEEVAMSSSGEVLLVSNEYNELGELIDKKLHSEDNGQTFEQSLDYRYNIRGWLKTINDSNLNSQDAEYNANADLFGMELVYNEMDPIENVPQYNGNISGMKWSVNLGLDDLSERAYSYEYDGINRIEKAEGRRLKAEGWLRNELNQFDVEGIKYDYNGNILSLNRKDGKGDQLDGLGYGYGEGIGMSNKLIRVDDEGDKEEGFKDGVQEEEEYMYDENGNMRIDKNKGIEEIWYNHLNQPQQLSMGADKGIRYTYDAAGIKVRKEVMHGDTLRVTDYVGPYVYEDGELQLVQHSEGRIVFRLLKGMPQ